MLHVPVRQFGVSIDAEDNAEAWTAMCAGLLARGAQPLVLELDAGHYRFVDGAPVLLGESWHLRGEGPEATFIDCFQAEGSGITLMAARTGVGWLSLCNHGAGGRTGISALDSHRVRLERVEFVGWDYPIVGADDASGWVIDCESRSCGQSLGTDGFNQRGWMTD